MVVTGEGLRLGKEKRDEVASCDVSPAFVHRSGPSAPIFKDGLSSFISCSAFHFIFLDIPASTCSLLNV